MASTGMILLIDRIGFDLAYTVRDKYLWHRCRYEGHIPTHPVQASSTGFVALLFLGERNWSWRDFIVADKSNAVLW
jgi:hypothetical protein